MKLPRIMSGAAPVLILGLTALGLLAGPPYDLRDGSWPDLLSGFLFLVHLLPGLLAATAVKLLGLASPHVEFSLLGILWAFLAWLQWRLVAAAAERRTVSPQPLGPP
jgi:hypothetical protein